jgi:hypothetical protein
MPILRVVSAVSIVSILVAIVAVYYEVSLLNYRIAF